MAAHGTDAWGALKEQVEQLAHVHLREMLEDSDRNASLVSSYNGIVMDYSRQRITNETMDLLMNLANVMKLKEKIDRMGRGEKINSTEGRAVLHVALRAPSDKEIYVDGKNVIPDVHEVLGRIKSFSESVRSGELKGASGKKLVNVVSIGIGGSYLGPEFVYEALRTEPSAKAAASGRMLRFLANVDPVDVSRALEGLNPEETLVIIISKTFTTAETMLNARTVRDWLLKNSKGLSTDRLRTLFSVAKVAKQMIAVSANVPKAQEFGIKEENVFGFWDWVGGRYSAVGMVPLSLQYGFDIMEQFLAGAHDIDNHFFETPLRENLPVILGVLGIWNSSFLGYPARALLPYSQALLRFPAHIQQVDMESNGKRVTINGDVLPIDVGEIDFGEPGTNGQHSFYQLIHQGRVIPADFIGFCESQSPVELNNEEVSNHDELMSNFFAQADALANGRTAEELEEIPEELRSHKSFPGNRPSTSILFPRLDAFTCGQLLSLFEHRTAVQGFIWDVNSFDQWGVELGKSLAKKVRQGLSEARKKGKAVNGFNSSTTFLMRHYLSHRS